MTASDSTAAAEALIELSATHPDLSATLARTVEALAREAQRTPRFAKALTLALSPAPEEDAAPRRSGRRAPGAIDPFGIYADGGEEGLRNALHQLSLEQLRDIVAENAMDHDRLAMKWKNPDRVIDRILEKVQTRSTKGSAFR